MECTTMSSVPHVLGDRREERLFLVGMRRVQRQRSATHRGLLAERPHKALGLCVQVGDGDVGARLPHRLGDAPSDGLVVRDPDDRACLPARMPAHAGLRAISLAAAVAAWRIPDCRKIAVHLDARRSLSLAVRSRLSKSAFRSRRARLALRRLRRPAEARAAGHRSPCASSRKVRNCLRSAALNASWPSFMRGRQVRANLLQDREAALVHALRRARPRRAPRAARRP